MCKTTNIFVIDTFNKEIANDISKCGKIAVRKLEDKLTELV